ncbi:hypothetical protein PVAG01_08783 [Phlyctema vagabunda]|uniref:Uncharacterized protein n=1 Tax=Phlyctema vagabunda TaxID=108571 RepID=A0ABR4PAH9_9HELO
MRSIKFFALLLFLAHKVLSLPAHSGSTVASARVFNYFKFSAGLNHTFTRLKSTMVVPNLPTGPNGLQSIWPGLQSPGQEMVFQNVVANQKAGVWGFWIMECCIPNHSFTPYVPVYPGDSITTEFARQASGNWTDSWILERGTQGVLAGAEIGQGNITDVAFPAFRRLNEAFFTVELGSGAHWEFGQMVWKDILMKTDRNDFAWCKQ